jgi:plasmid maintenance system antidote protein VapI
VSAIAELRPDLALPELPELAPTPRRLPVPPGTVPSGPVRAALRRYKAGLGTDAQLLATVDRHGEALEVEIARLAAAHLHEFAGHVRRIEALHARTADLIAQAAWLRAWPSGAERPAVPLAVEFYGRRVAVPRLLDALGSIELDERLTLRAERPRPRRRGAAASMAALADADRTTVDVADAVGCTPSKAWAMLNGHQPATPELWRGLARLLGPERAELVRAGIPRHPRARRATSPATRALRDTGVSVEDLAELIRVQPGTIRRWLNGKLRPSPKLALALEELLVDPAAAARIVSLIPLASTPLNRLVIRPPMQLRPPMELAPSRLDPP